jgi:hypothetical protein
MVVFFVNTTLPQPLAAVALVGIWWLVGLALAAGIRLCHREWGIRGIAAFIAITSLALLLLFASSDRTLVVVALGGCIGAAIVVHAVSRLSAKLTPFRELALSACGFVACSFATGLVAILVGRGI